jgi:hypothetical protein
LAAIHPFMGGPIKSAPLIKWDKCNLYFNECKFKPRTKLYCYLKYCKNVYVYYSLFIHLTVGNSQNGNFTFEVRKIYFFLNNAAILHLSRDLGETPLRLTSNTVCKCYPWAVWVVRVNRLDYEPAIFFDGVQLPPGVKKGIGQQTSTPDPKMDRSRGQVVT